MIAKSYSVIGKEWINNLPFPITSLCLRTDRIKDFVNQKFFKCLFRISETEKSEMQSISIWLKPEINFFPYIENQRFSISLNFRRNLR